MGSKMSEINEKISELTDEEMGNVTGGKENSLPYVPTGEVKDNSLIVVHYPENPKRQCEGKINGWYGGYNGRKITDIM